MVAPVLLQIDVSLPTSDPVWWLWVLIALRGYTPGRAPAHGHRFAIVDS